MLDTHPPFQIDGNFGAGAGILEMLIQSDEERAIRLLPACPPSWKTGDLWGVQARGGFELSFSWKDGQIQEPVTVRSLLGQRMALYFPNAGALIEVMGEEVHVIESTELVRPLSCCLRRIASVSHPYLGRNTPTPLDNKFESI